MLLAPPRLPELQLDDGVIRGLFASGVLLLLAVAIRGLGFSLLRRSGVEGENLLRLRAATRNVALGALVLGLIVIWADELQAVALSLVVAASAFAIATKELIACIVGTVYRGSMRPYAIGDRVVIGSARGDVLDISLLGTRIQEVATTASGEVVTGRIVVIPNSALFTEHVRNESADGPFVVDTIHLQATTENWQAIESRLLRAADHAIADFVEDAQRSFDTTTVRHGATPRRATPRCEVEVHGGERLVVHLHFPVPLTRRGEIRQAVWRHYLMRDQTSDPMTKDEPTAATDA